jgi:hypothetical protein
MYGRVPASLSRFHRLERTESRRRRISLVFHFRIFISSHSAREQQTLRSPDTHFSVTIVEQQQNVEITSLKIQNLETSL